MSINTYGLSKEKYFEFFKAQVETSVDLFLEFKRIAKAKNLNFDVYEDKFIWDFFQDVIYATDDDARIYQKKHDPKAIEATTYDPITFVSRDDLLNAINDLKALLEKQQTKE